MYAIFYGAVMGLLGSLHCIGMCGPLVASIHRQNKTFIHFAAYYIGKTSSYLLIGLLVGVLGSSLHLFLSQQKLSILIGCSFLIYFFIHKFQLNSKTTFPQLALKLSNQFFSYKLQNIGSKNLVMGIANGFLPCGLVYTAATASIASGHLSYSMLFMLGFGLGTIPSLTSVNFILKLIPKKFLPIWEKLYRYLTLLIGVLLILRGLNLGIPYLSPNFDTEKQEVGTCCHKH